MTMTESMNTTERSEKKILNTTRMMGGGGNVVGNNNANLVTIALSALIELSRGKEEERKSGEEKVEKLMMTVI